MTAGRHIQALCREHKIKRTVVNGRGRANVKERTIQHPPIRTEMAYFVALHEIGHVVNGLQGTRLEREALAWKYALDEALVKPHYSTRQRICACLVRYLYRAREHGWKLPKSGSLYYELLCWWT